MTLTLLFVAWVILFAVYPHYYVNSPLAVRRLPEHMMLLRRGMTESEVWQTLGVNPADRERVSLRGHHWERYPMGWYGYSVVLTLNRTVSPARLKYAGLEQTGN